MSPTHGSRSIAFVTGTRADWGKLLPLANAATEQGFRTTCFVTGMHMLRRYGDTRREVRREAPGDVHEFVNQSPGDGHDAILVKTIRGFGDWLAEYPADLVVLHGDRIEALAVALVCAMRYVPCAHIEGGEVSGTIDEIYRHCNTKLCRYHFVSSESAAERVRSLGEDPRDIFVIGSPELDLHSAELGVTIEDVRARYEIPWASCGIAVFHPVTSEIDSIAAQARSLFSALESTNRAFVVIAPNNDPGSDAIFAVLETLPQSRFKVLPSMRFAHFSMLMRRCSLIVGNSSLGVREAPFIGVPSLDIGTRQNKRAEAPSISHASAFDRAAIIDFVEKQWEQRFPVSDHFGKGNAGRRFASIITQPSFWDRPKQKSFHDGP